MHSYNLTTRGRNLEKASKAMICIHGRGGTAGAILGLAELLCDDSFYLAAPQATGNTWYPHGFMDEDEANEAWVNSAVEVIQRLIEETSRHIPQDQIYLMGFSQGACLSLEVSCRQAGKYGGILAFSGGLIGKTLHKDRYKGNFLGTKAFLGISERDPYIPLHRVDESRDILESMGADVMMKVYPDDSHNVRSDEIKNVKSFMDLQGPERPGKRLH